MGKIEVMSENLANKIAAGEVVEKCMNVVKELVENSIDAKATQIKINLVDSGVKEITIIDDGIGMDKEDAILAFSRHATSKVKNLEDLFYVSSLGFRGEALPSIAAVSLVDLKTSNGEVGTEVIIDGGEIKEVKQADLKKGTRITVKNLFYNTPVRLKYLKNLHIELANTSEYINKMALSFPNVKFTLTNNEKVIFNSDGSGNLLKVIGNVYGMDLTKKMIPIENSNDDYDINGYICYPDVCRSSKNNINILVNGRVIKNTEINKIIMEAYFNHMHEGKYPIVVLNINVDPILIDVNVHPTKMDIKFSKMDTLKELILTTINSKLNSLSLIPQVEIKDEKEDYIYNEEQKNESEELTLDLTDYEVNDTKEIYTKPVFKEEIKETSETKEDKIIDLQEVRLKKMRPIGAIHATFIVAENEDGMYLIDQHAAAERINYEIYLEKLSSNDNKKIDLLVPIKIELTSKEFIIIKENFGLLNSLGFDVEEFGINTIVIRSHPYWLDFKYAEDSIRKIIEIIISTESFDKEKFIDRVAASVACKASIKANQVISIEEMQDLLNRLRYTKNPFNCAHGRPTIISYSSYELDKMFKRILD